MIFVAVSVAGFSLACKNADERAQGTAAETAIATPIPAATETKVPPAPAPMIAAPALANILVKLPDQVVVALGEPIELGPDYRRYQVGEVKFLITYRDNLALDIIASSDSISSSRIKDWLGLSATTIDLNGRRFIVLDTPPLLCIVDTTPPKRRIDIKRVLGKRPSGVRQVLGRPETELEDNDIFKPWNPDDRIAISVHYDEQKRATLVTVMFEDGLLPPGVEGVHASASQLKWLGLPVADEVLVTGERYLVTVKAGWIELSKH